MSEKLFNSNDILKLVSKIEKRIDKLECWIEDCCAKIPTNIGTGIGLFKKYYKGKWQFKSILPGNNITITEQENTITINSTGGGGSFDCNDLNNCSTDNLPEGSSNLYFTNPRAVSALTGQNISIFNNNSGYITKVTESPNRVAYFDNNGDLKTNSNFVYNETSNLFTAALPIPGGFYQLNSGTSKIGVGDVSSPDAYIQVTPSGISYGIPLISADVFALPYNDGNAGDVMMTDGFGTITFQPIPASFITAISDTNTIDLDVTASNLTANVNYQNTSTINLSEDSSGLKADFASMNISQFTNDSGYTTNIGTVTSVAALTLGTTGTDLSSTVATSTTTPVITLNVPTASATNRGVLSSTDWSTFNAKQDSIGFTPENVANKSDSYTTSSSTTYATTKALVDGLATKTFSVPFHSFAFDPADGTNYFFGGITNLLAPSTTNTNQDFVIGYACSIVGCIIQAHGNTVQGTSEDVALSLRNNTANTTTSMGNFKTNATYTTTVVTAITGLNISVAASDLITLQMNGTWATNPTQVRLTGYLIIRL